MELYGLRTVTLLCVWGWVFAALGYFQQLCLWVRSCYLWWWVLCLESSCSSSCSSLLSQALLCCCGSSIVCSFQEKQQCNWPFGNEAEQYQRYLSDDGRGEGENSSREAFQSLKVEGACGDVEEALQRCSPCNFAWGTVLEVQCWEWSYSLEKTFQCWRRSRLDAHNAAPFLSGDTENMLCPLAFLPLFYPCFSSLWPSFLGMLVRGGSFTPVQSLQDLSGCSGRGVRGACPIPSLATGLLVLNSRTAEIACIWQELLLLFALWEIKTNGALAIATAPTWCMWHGRGHLLAQHPSNAPMWWERLVRK